MRLTTPNKRAKLCDERLETLLRQVRTILDHRPDEKAVLSIDVRELESLLEEVRDGRFQIR